MKTFKYLSLILQFCLFVSCKIHTPEVQNTVCKESSIGIDLSHHNGAVDWEKFADKSDVDFIYLKATEGKTYTDPMYATNLKEVRKHGFKVGSYHFFRMTSEAHEQFNHIIRVINKKQQDLLPMVDVETSDKHPVHEVQDSLQVLLDLLEKHYGAKPMIYATNRSYNELCAPRFNDYKLYIGRYGENPPIIKGQNHYLIWQYSEDGKLPGIQKPVDLCRFHPNNNLTDILLK